MRVPLLRLLLTAASLAGAQETGAPVPTLSHAGFEEVAADGSPAGWNAHDFGTGGQAGVTRADPHGGRHAIVLSSADATQRAAWRQKLAWPPAARAITVGGWYRTVDVQDAATRGASLRVLFHRDLAQWSEISLQQAFFPASPEWAQAQVTFLVPEETSAVVLELFHWLTPGATHWDDVWLRPATPAELATVAFPPDQQIDREPVLGRHKPYAPADGETVGLNPPPFLWLPSGPGARYRLEIGREPGFQGPETRRFADLVWCCEMLPEALAPGTWYWRYGADLAPLPTAWSRARRFEVPAKAAPWAYPPPASFVVPKARPRLFVRAERLAELRRRALAGDLQRQATGLVAAVKGFAGEPLIPEPSRLPAAGQARSQAYATIIRTTRPPMDRMETAALAYLLTGDAASAAEARRRILHVFGWDPQGSTGVFHNDEPAMWIMMRGVRAYDWTYDTFTPEERARVEVSLRRRAADFYQLLRRKPFENNPYESHAGRIIGFLGEAALAFAPEWPEAQTWLGYITRIYWGVYPAWGGDDGGWNEGPGYWAAYMSFALHFVVALREATGIDLSRRPFFQNTPYYRLYLTPPYAAMSPFGDGTQAGPAPAPELLYWFSTLTQDPRLRWYADELGRDGGGGILGVVLKDEALVGRPPRDLPAARNFASVGLVSLHSAFGQAADDVSFSLRASPYGAVSHGHNDQNCFVLEAYGEALAVASGYYNYYGSPHHDQWTRQTKAKCGITHDGGQGQDRGWQAQGRLAGFVHGEAFDLVIGDATPAYGGRLTKAWREVVHVRPGIFVLRDELASTTARRFEFRLHALDEMQIDTGAARVLIRRPKASLQAEFLSPAGLALSQTDQFDTPVAWPPERQYANQWHLTAALPEAVQAAEFLTVLTPAKTGQETARPSSRRLASTSAHGVELRFPDGGTVVVAYARSGQAEPLALGALRSDGALAAVRWGAGRTVRGWLVRGATRLEVDGVELLRAGAPMDLTASLAADGGRLDGAGAAVELTLGWPWVPQAVTRAGVAVPPLPAPGGFRVRWAGGADSLLVWDREPVPPGPITLALEAAGSRRNLAGVRYARGQELVAARLQVPPGLYRAELPPGASLTGVAVDPEGRFWTRGGEALTLSGRGLPERLVVATLAAAVPLAPLALTRLPAGIVHEAERQWGERGGEIRLSRGTHAGASANDCLWSWNLAGHELFWEIEVPQAGRYALWLVAASETGLLAEFRADAGDPLALWFEPSGGWARTQAGDWRAYEVRATPQDPLVLNLAAGRHRLALTNRSGMGLNLDRLVLVPQ